ncbi:hypothetical protein [Kutzneria sp. 744]|nr:hypothetical protein [Kutzneria sp. 744]
MTAGAAQVDLGGAGQRRHPLRLRQRRRGDCSSGSYQMITQYHHRKVTG